MKRPNRHGAALILLLIGVVAGCKPSKSNISTGPDRIRVVVSNPIMRRARAPFSGSFQDKATSRPANPHGSVFIVEYHHIRSGKGTMFRTTAEFESDLGRLYKDGFRPVTVSEYLDNKMPLPSGATPAVFTFDDANPSQIRFLDDGTLDPDCALGIWQRFAKVHPDFPIHATFYVLPNMWNQPKWVAKKIDLLHSLGCELADHTITHPILRKLTDDQVKYEIGEAALRLEKLGEKPPYSFAFPFGVRPKNKKLAEGFEYQGQKIELKAALAVGANPAPSPTDPKLNRYYIPRIQACAGPSGLDDWLGRFEKGVVKVYVSP